MPKGSPRGGELVARHQSRHMWHKGPVRSPALSLAAMPVTPVTLMSQSS